MELFEFHLQLYADKYEVQFNMNRSDKNLKNSSKTPRIQNCNLKSFFQSVLIPINISTDTPSGIKDQLKIFSVISLIFKNHLDVKAGSDKSNSESVNVFADLHPADADMHPADANMHPADANMNLVNANMYFSDADMDPADANMDLADAVMDFADAGMNKSDANIQFTENKFKRFSKQKNNAFDAVEKIFKQIQVSKRSKYKHSKRIKLSGLIKQFTSINTIVSDADSYLHYSNLIMIEAGRDLPAINLISIKFFTGGGLKLIIIKAVTLHNHKPAVYFAVLSETVSAFEGVIERYCGVPP